MSDDPTRLVSDAQRRAFQTELETGGVGKPGWSHQPLHLVLAWLEHVTCEFRYVATLRTEVFSCALFRAPMSAVYNDVFCNTVICVMATIDSFFYIPVQLA